MPRKIVAVVDAYSVGAKLAPILRKRGFIPVHIRSAATIPPDFRSSFVPNDFDEEIIHFGNIAQTILSIQRLHPICVIAGTESGVELSDRLSSELGLLSNGTQLSRARRDKFLMIENIRAAGLHCANQLASPEPLKILEWVETNGFPCVIKPLSSAGTDGVFVCRKPAEVILAAKAILGKRNRLGVINESVLVQSYLDGPEYIVNTVSRDGCHYVTEVLKYQKITLHGRDKVYDTMEMLPTSGQIQTELTNYFFRCLDALGIQNGPAHGEIIITGEGPALVEVGARCAGASLPILSKECFGYCQVEATVDAYLEPEKLRKQMASRSLRKAGKGVFLISREEGLPSRRFPISKLEASPAFIGASVHLGKEHPLERTTDLFTSPGIVFFAHEKPELIETSYRILRRLEEHGLYKLMSPLKAS